jgi:maleylacetate reductase
MPEEGIAEAAEQAVGQSLLEPAPIERDPVEALIRAAWSGERPIQTEPTITQDARVTGKGGS